MNPEEYIIIKKSDLQEFVNKITLDNKELPEFISGIYALNNYINSKISKPLQPLLEETFEESKRQHDWAGGHIYGKGKYGQEEEDLTDWKYPNFEDFIKQKEI